MIGRRRLSLIAGPIAMAMLVASSGWVLWSGFERSKAANQSVEHTYTVLVASESFLGTLREVESALRAYVLTRDEAFLPAYQAALEKQARMLDQLDRLTKDNPRQQTQLKKIRALTAQRLAVLAEAERNARAGASAAIARSMQRRQGTKLMTDLTGQVREFEGEERRLLAVRAAAAADAVSWTRFLLVLTSSLLAVVLLFAGVAAERYVRTREASLDALKRQADLIDYSHDAIVTLDPKGVITGWNAGAEEVYGWTSAEAVGRDSQEILKVDAVGMLAKTGRWDGELAHTTKDGQTRLVESRYVQVRNRAGAPVGVLNISRDETQRKHMEHELRESQAVSDRERRRLGAILETMPAGVVLADVNNKLVEGNAEAVKIWRAEDFANLAAGIASAKAWRAGSGELMRLEDWPRTRALKGEAVLGEIIDIERFDGSKGTVFNSASPVRDAEGVIHGAVGVMVDVTEQRQIELALRRSEESMAKLLEQKNILFQEVQHRVKNNLQIVSSLLSLEAQKFEDTEFRNALNESRDRIRSMALMHEKFYHLDDLARIEFADYVDELARYFFSSYIAEPSMIGFASEVDVKLSMGDAMPCGLILQELLSNSVKHAFPKKRGDIRIEFHERDEVCRLRYWDSGQGLPPTVDLKNPMTLGLQLVTDLAAQLDGTIEYEYKDGALFTLSFDGRGA